MKIFFLNLFFSFPALFFTLNQHGNNAMSIRFKRCYISNGLNNKLFESYSKRKDSNTSHSEFQNDSNGYFRDSKSNGHIDYEELYSVMEIPLSKYIERNINMIKSESNIRDMKPSEIVDYGESIDLRDACRPRDYSDVLYKKLEAPEIPPKMSENKENNLYKQCSDMIAEQDSMGFRFPFGGSIKDMYSKESVYKGWGKTSIEALSPIYKNRSSSGYGYYIGEDKTLAERLTSNQYYEDVKLLKDQVHELRSNRFERFLDAKKPFVNLEEVIKKANQINSEIDMTLNWLNPYNPWDEFIHLQDNTTLFSDKSKPMDHYYNDYKAAFQDNDEIDRYVNALRSSVYVEDVLQYYGETDEERLEKNPFKSERLSWDPEEMPFDRLFEYIYPPYADRPLDKFKVRYPRKSVELDADLKQERKEDLPWVLTSSFYGNNVDEYQMDDSEAEVGEMEGADLSEAESLQDFSDKVAMVPEFDPNFKKYRQSLKLAFEALSAARRCMGYSYAGDIFRDQRFARILDIITRTLALEYVRISTKSKVLKGVFELDAGYLAKILNELSAWNVKGGDFIYEFSALLLLHYAKTATISQIVAIAIPVFNRLGMTRRVRRKWISKLVEIVESRLSESVLDEFSNSNGTNSASATNTSDSSSNNSNRYENFKQFLPILQMCYPDIPCKGFVSRLKSIFPEEIAKFFTSEGSVDYPSLFILGISLMEIDNEYNDLICKRLEGIDNTSARDAVLAYKFLVKGGFSDSLSQFKGIILEKRYELSPAQVLDLIGYIKSSGVNDGLFVFNLLDKFRGIFNPSYDELFQAFEYLLHFKGNMTKDQVDRIADEFISDSADYSLISHVGLNAEYLGYPLYVTARLLKYSALLGYINREVWQSFYELLEMHKHTLNLGDILEALEAISAAKFTNVERIVRLLVSRAADVIECSKTDNLDLIISIMDLSRNVIFPRELLRWVTYSMLYGDVNDDVCSVLNDPEPKDEYYCFRGLRSEAPNKRLLQAPQHSFNELAYATPDMQIIERKRYKKFDYSLLDSPSIQKHVNKSHIERIVGFIEQLVGSELPLKIERRLFLNLLELGGMQDKTIYTNLLHRLSPSKIKSNV